MVHLVLSLLTGYVSTQFHIKCNDRFETVRLGTKTPLPSSQWQQLAGFTTKDKVTTRNEGAPLNLPAPLPTATTTISMPTMVTTQPPAHTTAPTPPNDPTTVPKGAPIQDDSMSATANVPTCRSTCTPKPTQHLRESQEQANIVFEAQFIFNLQDELEINIIHLIAYAASNNPDTLHLHQVLREPDTEEFRKAMQKELADH